MASAERAVLLRQMNRLYRDGSYTTKDDAQLLERYLSGRDDGAFEAIVNLHGPMILSLCRRFLRDPRDIEDAFQATFLILASRADSIRKREVLSSWLYGVAYRVAVRCRSEVMRRRSVEIGVPGLETPDRSNAADDDVGPALDQELSRLPEKYRAPIVLCYLKEQTHDQAAAALRWPVGTVRSRLARGRELLRERLSRRGYAPAGALLGLGPGFPARSFTAAVPQPLVEATVAAAGQCASGAGPAILFPSLSMSLSGSAATLAQGVLTTMAFSQIKWIGAGMAALGMLAGGAGAWALGAGRAGEQADKAPTAKTAEKAVTRPAGPNVAHVPPPSVVHVQDFSVEARLADLERKLDQLLRLVAPKGFNPAAIPPPVASGDVAPVRDLPTARAGGLADSVPAPGPDVQAMPPPTMQPRPQREATPSLLPSKPGELPASRAEVGQASDYDVPRTQRDPFYRNAPLNAAPELSPFELDRTPPARRPGSGRARVLPSPGSPPPVAPAGDVAVLPDLPAATSDEIGPALNQNPVMPRSRRDSSEIQLLTRTSLKEIQAQLGIARIDLERNETLFKSGLVGKERCEASLGQIRVLLGRLEGWDEELAEEAERLKVEADKGKAALNVGRAQAEITQTIVARNSRLNERKPGMVSSEEVAKAEAENKRAAANVELKRAELQEVSLKSAQLQRRQATIRRVIEQTLKTTPDLARENVPFPAGPDPRSERPRD
jgi:RNA polymerase sigma factor (sigma-70 family)